MNCVILQPSFIPWRGYFHQIQKADVFVFYDCVQYDKRGWRHRNKIKTPQGPQWLSVPVNASGSHEGLAIKDVPIAEDGKWRRKHLAAFEQNYRKAPHYETIKPLLERIYALEGPNLVDLTCPATEMIAAALGIGSTRFVRSSTLDARGQKTDRLLEVLAKVGATHYISGPSARDYLEIDKFTEAGISVEFMSYDYSSYPQLHGDFEPAVTVLDLLFNAGPDAGRFIWTEGDDSDVRLPPA